MTETENELMKLVSEPENMKALTSLEIDSNSWSIFSVFSNASNGTQQFCKHQLESCNIAIKSLQLFKDEGDSRRVEEVFYMNFPAGTSSKSMKHNGQMK